MLIEALPFAILTEGSGRGLGADWNMGAAEVPAAGTGVAGAAASG
jgi:hypothetical protein